MPNSVKDRFTVDFEYLFFFTKSKKYYFEQQFEPIKAISIKRAKYGWNCDRPSTQSNGGVDVEIMGERFVNLRGRNKRCVWTIPPKSFKESHFAVFPPELVVTPITAGCPNDGIVLDPFMGAGTTAVVAKQLKRNFIGIELNPEYIAIAEKRINSIEKSMF
jgi:site-specific DNA-methyltransferase (adenine-specific)